MLFTKSFALVAMTVASATAYSKSQLGVRSYRDVSLDDLDVLFERDYTDLSGRNLRLDADNGELLFERDMYEEDLYDHDLFSRDHELDPEYMDVLLDRDMPDSDDDMEHNIKRSPGQCLSCTKRAAKKTSQAVSGGAEAVASGVSKGASASKKAVKSAAKGTAKFVKDTFSEEAIRNMHPMGYSDPMAAMYGGYYHNAVGSGGRL